MALLPALMPAAATATSPTLRPSEVRLAELPPADVMFTPLPSTTVSPTVTLLKATSSLVATVILFSAWVSLIFFPASTVTVSPFCTFSTFEPATSPSDWEVCSLKPADLSWATLTASVSWVPAAREVIWRVMFPSASPTDTAARVDFHAAMVLSAAEPNGSAPTAPLSTEALLARPKATPSETVTDVPLPNATAPVIFFSPAKVTVSLRGKSLLGLAAQFAVVKVAAEAPIFTSLPNTKVSEVWLPTIFLLPMA